MAASESDYTVTASPFPATTKSASAIIKGAETTATTIYFADKILVTITQNGRLAHWVSPIAILHMIDFSETNLTFLH